MFATRINRSPASAGFTTTLAEDVPVATPAGAVTATDPDSDPLTFAVTAGDPSGMFTIGATSGIVTIAKSLDYETTTSHTLTVTVSDGSLTDTATITVNVTDVVESSNSFVDDDGSVFEADIEWLAAEGVTKGCNPPVNDMFCPNKTVTRGQMAAFLHRALGGIVEPSGDPIDFTDDDTSTFVADIAWLSATGITKGCTATEYCPGKPVTRGQMAAFLVRAMGYSDDGGGDLFVDDDDSIFESDIDRLATAGVTRGCNPPVNDRFCPTNYVTRGQMAAFLHRALG